MSDIAHKINLRLREKFRRKKYRDVFVWTWARYEIVGQIRQLRGKETQAEFAARMGLVQSAVSGRLENPNYAGLKLRTLFDIAAKNDMAVLIKFVSHDEFLNEIEAVSERKARGGKP